MFLYGLLNRANVKASKRVLFPDPFSPLINVVDVSVKDNSVKVFPVLRKFRQRIVLNVIIPFVPQHIVHESGSSNELGLLCRPYDLFPRRSELGCLLTNRPFPPTSIHDQHLFGH